MPYTNTENLNEPVRQWVSNVLRVSSEYNNDTWCARNVIGAPTVYPSYGDLQGAWAQANDFHANHFIEFEYPKEVYVEQLNIYETYHAGGVVNIKLKNKKLNKWISVWESSVGPLNIETSRIFSPDLDKTLFKTNQIRLDINCTAANGYCEIDAIELVGKQYLVDFVETEKTLGEDLGRLLSSEEFSDIQFEVEGKVLKAHRNILTSRSDYFKALLCENLRPDRLSRPVHIDHISYNGFKALLYYFYTDKIDEETSCETACELARASDWYNIPDLKEKSFYFNNSKLSSENVIGLYVSAVTLEPKLEDIEEICLKFIAKNFTSVIERPEFKKLPQNILVQITQFYAQFHK